MLGAGAFGQVFLGRWTVDEGGTSSTRDVAVKVMTPSRNERERAERVRSFQEEAGMMGKFRGCERIVQMVASDVQNSVCWIVYELLPNGTLGRRIHDETLPRFSLSTTLRIALDIAKGLAALHAENVAHRDLKPDNLLLDAEFRPKLIDVRPFPCHWSPCSVCCRALPDSVSLRTDPVARNWKLSLEN